MHIWLKQNIPKLMGCSKSRATTWMNLRNIILSERSQTQKVLYNIIWFYLYEISRTGKSIETESRLVVTWGWEQGEIRSNYLMGTRFLLGVMKMFWNLIEVVVAQHREYTKCHWIVHFSPQLYWDILTYYIA